MKELLLNILSYLLALFLFVLPIACVLIFIRSRFRRRRGPTLIDELTAFLGRPPRELPIVSRSFAVADLPNLHLAIERLSRKKEARARLLGFNSHGYNQQGLKELLAARGPFEGARSGPVNFRQVDIDVDRQMQCVENGLHLLEFPEGKLIAYVHADSGPYHGLELEVMSGTKEFSAAFLEDVLSAIREVNVYKGKVITLESGGRGWGASQFSQLRFHRMPAIHGEEIILPPETKTLLERNTIGFFKQAEALRRSGRSLRRGILLHGKPGTGKSYTAKWLAQSLPGVTVILLTGEQLGLIKECCQMARMLAPSLVIMEDVDLVASARDESRHPFYQITLHQLLNEMDGVASDADVIFLLTTNRPQAIERALAARPGRVDQAIEFPLPGAEDRRRLLELYGRGLTLDLRDPDRIVVRTEGASPAFIQELVRKAALFAAEENSHRNGGLLLTDAHFDLAIRELVLGGGELTRNLLGFETAGGGSTPLSPHRDRGGS